LATESAADGKDGEEWQKSESLQWIERARMFLAHCFFCALATLIGWIVATALAVALEMVLPGTLMHDASTPSILAWLSFFVPIAIANVKAASKACLKLSSDGARWV
jgi:hypothetical protein